MSERLLRHRDYAFIVVRRAESWAPRHGDSAEWNQAGEAATELAKLCRSYERDGLTVYFAADPLQKRTCSEPAMVQACFQMKNAPNASNLQAALKDVLTDYFARRGLRSDANGLIVIILLDHVPADQKASILKTLVDASKRLTLKGEETEGYELGVSFIQVGRDPDTREFITHLDNQLKAEGGRHDIVDAKVWYQVSQRSLKTVLLDSLTD